MKQSDIAIAIHAGLMLRARRGRYMAILDPDRWQESVDEHDAILAAFHAGDPGEARRIWRSHLLHTGETICEVLSSQLPADLPDAERSIRR